MEALCCRSGWVEERQCFEYVNHASETATVKVPTCFEGSHVVDFGPRKMAGSCIGTGGAGSLSAPSAGWGTSTAWWYTLTIYRAFFHIACFMVVLRRVLQ